MKFILYTLFFSIALLQSVFCQSQVKSIVSSQFFSVKVEEKAKEDFRDLLKDIQELVPKFVVKQPLFNHVFAGDSASPRLAFDELGQMHLQSDSTGFIMLHFFSTWFKSGGEWYSEISKGEVVSMKYLEYFAEFLRTESGLIVALSPSDKSVALNKMQLSESSFGGKELLVIRYKGDMSYYDALKQYSKALKSCCNDDDADLNKDRVISFSERLLSLRKFLQERELSLEFYQLFPGGNPGVAVLDK